MFSDPLKNLKALGIREIDTVADLGAGTGFYSIFAGHIAPRGKVYAVEITKDFLEIITKKIKEAKLKNVEVIWGDVEKDGGTKIGTGVVDKVIASNVLFQVEKKEVFISEIKRILKDGGEVLFIDWSTGSSLMNEARVVPKLVARGMFEKKGFIWQRDIDAGLHHYGMIFKKG